jgi:tripartite-type tricarboxylate transporter receptor subunit TctC
MNRNNSRWIAAAVALASTGAAWGQAYPTKPVRMIVPFAPGGATDIVARLISQRLGEAWNQQVVVDNRAGAGGNIGGELTAKSPPDGYTLFMTSGSIVSANPFIYRKMPFDPAKDLAAVTGAAIGPQLLVVTSTFPPKTVKEFIALAKARPGQIAFGSAGFGTQTHLAAENFIWTAKIDLQHVPYKGEAPALIDTIAGQVQFATPNMAAAINYVQQDKLRAIGVTSKERSKQLPNVPAVAETLPGFENLGWFAIMVPAGTPRDVIEKINRDTMKALEGTEIKTRFDGLGMAPFVLGPADLAKYIREESTRWAQIVKERKLVIE